MSRSNERNHFRYCGPIVGVKVYKNDVVVVREGDAPPTADQIRGEIAEFSRKSRQRLAFIAANTEIRFLTMITLTYPKQYETDGKVVKANLQAFLQQLRREYPSFSYLWFLEFQRRGAPHIHVLLTIAVPRSRSRRKELYWRISAWWYRICATGDEKHLAAGTKVESMRLVDGGARYAVKEACKMRQKIVPPNYRNVGRFYGYSRDVPPPCKREIQLTEDDLRGVLEDWPYAPNDDRMMFKVLYGAASLFEKENDGG